MTDCASENEIRAAVADALDGMRKAGCLSCPSFERCVGRLNAFGQSAPAPLRGGARTANALGKAEKRKTSGGWGRWFSRFRTTALAVAAAVSTFSASAVVQCVWDNNSGTYICSGEGSLVTVIGGGNGDVVITNVVGVCTNCVAMSPQYVRNWKETALTEISFIDSELSSARMYARTITNDLYAVAHAGDGLQYFTGTYASAAERNAFVDDQIVPNSSSLVYTAAAAGFNSNSSGDTFPYGSSANRVSAVLGCWNGALAYANQVAPTARDSIEYAEAIEGSVGYVIDERLPTMRVMIGDLSDEECTAQWDGGNDGGGSGATTNSLSGNWCTYDQGEAIKELLGDLKEWGRQAVARLSAISNFTEQTVRTLRSGLFSDYTAIPEGTDWQTVYLQGQPTGWGYDPTNILQRLEMLVYGISGIATNSDAFTSDDYPEDASAVTNNINLVTDAAAAQAGADTLGDALVEFFDLFSDLGGRSMQSGEFLLDDSSFALNGENFDVPGLTASDNGNLVGTYNLAQSLVSAGFTVVYCLFGIMAVWFYWTWFAEKALWFTKWISEVVNSLFAS